MVIYENFYVKICLTMTAYLQMMGMAHCQVLEAHIMLTLRQRSIATKAALRNPIVTSHADRYGRKADSCR